MSYNFQLLMIEECVMKKRICIFCFVLCMFLLSACMNNQSVVESTLAELAQPSWNGRQVGTPGNAMAETYLKEQLIKYGYQPLIENDFAVPYEQIIPDTATAPSFSIIYRNGAKEELVPGVDFILNFGVEAFSFQGSIVMNPKEDGTSSQAALFQDSEQALHPPEGYGLIIMPSEGFSYKCNGENLSKPYRINVSPEIYNKLTSSEIEEIKLSYSPKHKLGTVHNVAGVLKGKSSKKAVVLSAHFDGAAPYEKIPFTCAYDNGSGVAALVEIARMLSEYRENNVYDKDIVVCFLNGEETELAGSAEFAGKIKERYDEVYNINIDCVGGKNCGSLTIMPPDGESQLLFDEVIKELNEQQISYTNNGAWSGDNSSFSNLRIPALTLGQENFLNLAHSQNDKLENLDLKQIQEICNFVYQFIIDNEEKSFTNPNWNDSIHTLGPDVLQEADKVTEDIDLAFNEIYVFKYNGKYYRKSGNHPLHSEEEFKEYYPHAGIPKFENNDILDGFSLESIDITNELCIPVSEYEGKQDVGKVAIVLDQRKIGYARFLFAKGDDVIEISFRQNSTDPGMQDLKGTELKDEYTGYVKYYDVRSGEASYFGYVDKAKKSGVFVQYYTRKPIIIDGNPYSQIDNKLNDDLIMSFINAFDFKNNYDQYSDCIFGKR